VRAKKNWPTGRKRGKESFAQLGFKEADSFKSSSTLICQYTEQSIYAQDSGMVPMVIKK